MKDKDLWKSFTEDIKPLKKEEKGDAWQEKPPKPRPKYRDDFSSSADHLPTRQSFDPTQPSNIDKNTYDRLKKGKMQIEARLDLHGCTHQQAYDLVHKKLMMWQAHGKRCVIVVTGKGLRSENPRDTLKNRFPEWLNEGALRKIMVAFCHAQPKDGGSGAFYVLLKAQRDH